MWTKAQLVAYLCLSAIMSCTQSTLVCLLPQVAIVPSSQVKYLTMQYSLGVPDRLRGAVANKPESVGQAVKSEKKIKKRTCEHKKKIWLQKAMEIYCLSA